MAALPASAANWSDTYLGYQYSNKFRDPGIVSPEVKNRTELSGVYGWDYGTNFFDVNMLWASHRDPANDSVASGSVTAPGQDAPGVPGDTEVYIVYRSNFDLGKIFKTDLSFGPVREVDFTVGFDFDSTDNQFASNKKYMVAGPQFGLKVNNGFWNLGAGACREQNYNGIVQHEVDFRTTYVVWTAWEKNFNLGVPVSFHGWANYIGAKGKDGFGANTVPETVSDMYLMFDISKLFGRKKGAIYIGPGFEYWNNKFGDRNYTDLHNTNLNTLHFNANNEQVTAPMLCAEFHF
jgi:nucleoside-specific outer membrane channel protein Tsx